MKERLLTLAFAFAALVVFYALLAPKPPARDTVTSRPTSAESRANGYLAALRWLQSTGVPVVSLRERYAALEHFAPVGNLLILTLPHRFPARYLEQERLRKWVEAGNTLLVMASLGDTPDWSLPSMSEAGTSMPWGITSDVMRFAGIYPYADHPDEEQDDDREARVRAALQPYPRPLRLELAPTGRHPLFDGVQRVVAETEYPADKWFSSTPHDGFVLTLAREKGSAGEAFWTRRMGAGTVLVSAYASIFTNELLGEADNARLLSNIVARTVKRDGAVIFDDMHQGLSRLYHPEAFFSDPRLHNTAWLLLALWLIWVLGATRLRTPPPPAPTPDEAVLVRATGGFLARVLKPAQAAVRLLELFFNDLRRRLGQPENGEPLWAWLDRRSHLSADDLTTLRSLHARASAGRRVDLKRLQALILRIQEQVT